jgi:hypothetical protein
MQLQKEDYNMMSNLMRQAMEKAAQDPNAQQNMSPDQQMGPPAAGADPNAPQDPNAMGGAPTQSMNPMEAMGQAIENIATNMNLLIDIYQQMAGGAQQGMTPGAQGAAPAQQPGDQMAGGNPPQNTQEQAPPKQAGMDLNDVFPNAGEPAKSVQHDTWL